MTSAPFLWLEVELRLVEVLEVLLPLINWLVVLVWFGGNSAQSMAALEVLTAATAAELVAGITVVEELYDEDGAKVVAFLEASAGTNGIVNWSGWFVIRSAQPRNW